MEEERQKPLGLDEAARKALGRAAGDDAARALRYLRAWPRAYLAPSVLGAPGKGGVENQTGYQVIRPPCADHGFDLFDVSSSAAEWLQETGRLRMQSLDRWTPRQD